MLVDIHCHLDHPLFKKDLAKVLERAKSIVAVTSGIDFDSNRFVLDLAKRHPQVQAMIGLYPQNALAAEIREFNLDVELKPVNVDEELAFVEKNKNNIFGLGEIGMDFMMVKDKRGQREQKILFEKQLALAEKIKKPVLIHSRKAEIEVIGMLENTKLKKVIMHCFCGKKRLVQKIQDNGWYFSIPTSIVRSQQFQFIAQTTRMSRLLTETDSPYLSPFKGKRNEPAFVIESVKKIAELKGVLVEEAEKMLYKNYQDLL